MNRSQIHLLAEMLTDDPDIFTEDLSGSMGTGGMAGNVSQPSPPKRAADVPTEQPLELGADKPIDAADIRHQASQMGNSGPAADAMADQMQQQEEMEQEQQKQRQKVLKPQFDELNSTISGLQDGVLQGKQAATTGNEQFGNLEKEMVGLNTLLGSLQQQV